jgi:hypothetical protein
LQQTFIAEYLEMHQDNQESFVKDNLQTNQCFQMNLSAESSGVRGDFAVGKGRLNCNTVPPSLALRYRTPEFSSSSAKM